MRYRIKAWGSDKFPDLDYESSLLPIDLRLKYPYVDVACLTPIPLATIRAGIDGINTAKKST